MLSEASFWIPEYNCPNGWAEHAPFVFWITQAMRPRRVVELGTYYGYSYNCFCQAIVNCGLDKTGTDAFAVDTWEGDQGEFIGPYGEQVFDTMIPRSVRIAEAPSFGLPVVAHAPASRGAVAYRALLGELEAREADLAAEVEAA